MEKADLKVVIDTDDASVKSFDDKIEKMIRSGKAIQTQFTNAGLKLKQYRSIYADAVEKMVEMQQNLKRIEDQRRDATFRMEDAEKRRYNIGIGRGRKELIMLNDLYNAQMKELEALDKRIKMYQKLEEAMRDMSRKTPFEAHPDYQYDYVYDPLTNKPVPVTGENQQHIEYIRKINEQEKAVAAAEKETAKLKRQIMESGQVMKTGGRDMDFWNSSLIKFGVVMSGIAATLFVFQQIGQIFATLGRYARELAETSILLESVVGSFEKTERIIGNLRSNTNFPMSEINKGAGSLRGLGYSSGQIEAAFPQALRYVSTGLVDMAQAMEIATTDIYGISESLDYYVMRHEDSVIGTQRELQSMWDHFMTEGGTALWTVLGWFVKARDYFKDKLAYLDEAIPGMMTDDRMRKLATAMRKGGMFKPTPWFRAISDAELGLKPAGSTSGSAQPSRPFYSPELYQQMYEEIFKATGQRTSGYFDKLENDFSQKRRRYLDMANNQSVISNEDKNIISMYLDEQHYKMKWDEIFAEQIKASDTQIKYYEKLLKETDYYHPTLKMRDDLEAQRRRGLATDLAKDVYGRGSSSLVGTEDSDLYGISLTWLQDQFKIFENDMQGVKKRGEAALGEFGIMTDEFIKFRNEYNQWREDIDRAKKDPLVDVNRMKADLDLIKDINQTMFEDQAYSFERLKKISDDYYYRRSEQIMRERDLAIATGHDRILVEQEYADRRQELDDMHNRTYGQGFKSSVYEMVKNQEDMFDVMKRASTETFASMGNTFRTVFSDLVKGEAKSLADYFDMIFNSIVDSWADMMSKMLMNSIMSGIFSGIFGGGSGGIGIGDFGSVVNLGGQRASGGPVYAGSTYLVGERGPELLHMGNNSGTVSPGMGGGTVNVVVNEAPPGTTVTRSRSGGVDTVLINAGAGNISEGGPMARAIEQRYGIRPMTRRS